MMLNDAIDITVKYNTKQKVEGRKFNVSYNTKTIIYVTLVNRKLFINSIQNIPSTKSCTR